MVRCPTCGTDNGPNVRFCGECGTSMSTTSQQPSSQPSSSTYQQSTTSQSPQYTPRYSTQPQYQQPSAYSRRLGPEDTADGWVYCCSFCVPIVGLVLFIIWYNERPNTARTMGALALFSFILSIVFGIMGSINSFSTPY